MKRKNRRLKCKGTYLNRWDLSRVMEVMTRDLRLVARRCSSMCEDTIPGYKPAP